MTQSLKTEQRDEQGSDLEIRVTEVANPVRLGSCETVEECPTRPALKRMVLATDFSDNSLRALPLLTAMVRSCGVELYLVHLITPGAYKSIPCDSISWGIDELIDNANVMMAGLLRSEMLTGVPIAGTMIVQGTAEDLQKLVRNHRVDLLAVGIHGSGLSQGSALGGFVKRIVHEPPCPLLLF